MGLEKTGKKIAGRLVTPAVWVSDYAAQRKEPDPIDVGLYILGTINIPSAVASIATGTIKSIVDDRVTSQLKQVRSGEDNIYKQYIFACHNHGSLPPAIIASKIAAKGGTAWQHPNGLWAFIVDRDGKMVADFTPNKWVVIFQPEYPFQETPTGGIRWTQIRK